MEKKIFHYPFWLRIWHWINAVLCILLIISGISMQYSDPDYPLISFDIAVSMHNISGILLTAGYIGFLYGNIKTRNGQYYKINWSTIIPNMKKQLRFYLVGLFLKEPSPFPVTEKRKFNPLQKFAYVGVMYILFPVLIITGWALLFPNITIDQVFGTSGLRLTDILHIIAGFFVSIFLVIHIYFSTIGLKPSSNFKAMFDGYARAH